MTDELNPTGGSLTSTRWRALLAEGLGTATLVTVVIGSGAMAERLSPGDVGLQLFENAVATGAGLFVLILLFARLSGAQFNPIVTGVDASLAPRSVVDVSSYVAVQVVGAVVGAIVANAMFDLPILGPSSTDRLGASLLFSEVVATAGLVTVIFGLVRSGRASHVAAAVAAYITAAYFFTSSTSFANPAVTIGRALTDSFAGIAPSSVAPFIGAQVLGGVLGYGLVRVLWPITTGPAAEFAAMEEQA